MKALKSLIHILFPQKCVEQAVWSHGVLQCPCGSIIALRYDFEHEERLFIYPEFKKFRKSLMHWHGRLDDGKYMATYYTDDFSDFLAPVMSSWTSDYISETNNEEDKTVGESISEG